MGRHRSPRYGYVILVNWYSVLTAVNWPQHGFAISGCTLSHQLESVAFFLMGCPVVRTGRHFTTNIAWVESNQIFLAVGLFSHKLRARVELPYQSIKFKIISCWKC